MLTSRALGMEVDMCIVRCNRFHGSMAPICRGARTVSMCAVCTPSRILGCYELTDGLGGIMFRRMTDTLCCELIGAPAGSNCDFKMARKMAHPSGRLAVPQRPARLRLGPTGRPLVRAFSWRAWGSASHPACPGVP